MNNKGISALIFLLSVSTIFGAIIDRTQSNDFFSVRYLKGLVNYNLYDLSGNPAFLERISYPYLDHYQLSANRQNLENRRTFDPAKIDHYQANFQWIRQLPKTQTIAGGINYTSTIQQDKPFSLEKNFYDSYFGFSDYTAGNFHYQGPTLWVLYHRPIFNQLNFGLDINYGIERGLKDIFTECKTIDRNFDVTAGLSYQLSQTTLGLYTTIFNRSVNYEAVENKQVVASNIWFGYHLKSRDLTGANVRKKLKEQGYNIGLQLENNHLFDSNFGYRILTELGRQKNNIKAGRMRNLTPMGYRQNDSHSLLINLFYRNKKINSQLYGQLTQCNDWTTPYDYDITAVKSDNQTMTLGGIIHYWLNPYFSLMGGLDMQWSDLTYQEYISTFQYVNIENQKATMLGIKYTINSDHHFYSQGKVNLFDRNFLWPLAGNYWQYDLTLGYLGAFSFGQLDISLNYSIENSKYNINNNTYGLTISWIKY